MAFAAEFTGTACEHRNVAAPVAFHHGFLNSMPRAFEGVWFLPLAARTGQFGKIDPIDRLAVHAPARKRLLAL